MNNRIEDRGLWIEDAGCNVPRAEGLTQSSIPDPESSGRSFSYGNRTAYPLRVRSSRGFTLVELLVVVSLVAILASMLFTRVLFYQEMAEKAAVQQVAGALQGALVLQYGHRLTLGMDGELNNISTENPMNWLAQKPANYLGEFNAIKPGAIESGNWAFDRTSHELIYIPDHAEYFEPARDGVKWIRFRTRFAYEAAPGNKSKRVKELTGVTFAPVEPYQWLIREN
jgi:prepilin-type N-terminal cleavage/methylation domain-containing protein